nr:CD1845 family protein [Bacteroides acidifaciens]
MVAQYVVAAPKVENINFGWFSSGKLVAPKEDNIQVIAFLISPMGLPLAAIWLLGKVQDLKFAIQDWMYG